MAKEKKPRKPRGKFKEGNVSIVPTGPPKVEGLRAGSVGQMRTVEWDWREVFMRRALNLIEGRKGTGKSSLLAKIAAHYTGGPPLPGEPEQAPASVLWHGPEEDYDSEILPRIVRAGGDPSWCFEFALRTQAGFPRRLTLPSGAEELTRIMLAARVRMFVADPLGSLADPGIVLKDDQDIHIYLECLADILRRTGATAYLVRHLTKGVGGDVRDAGLGGSGIINTCRTCYRLDEHLTEKGMFVMSSVATNWGAKDRAFLYRLPVVNGVPGIEWCGESQLTADMMAAGRGDEAARDETRDAMTLIRASLAEGPRASADLIAELEQAGITRYALKAAKAALRVTSERKHDGPAGKPCWYWKPPEGGFPPDIVPGATSSPPPPGESTS